jgi:hypothetical protein
MKALEMAIESHHGNSKVTSYILIQRSKVPTAMGLKLQWGK